MEHPITPPLEFVEQWHSNSPLDRGLTLATRAAQWGADQELEACCEWLGDIAYRQSLHLNGSHLRAARRPKPPSLKEQALAALEQVEADFNTGSFGDTIRRALKALPNG